MGSKTSTKMRQESHGQPSESYNKGYPIAVTENQTGQIMSLTKLPTGAWVGKSKLTVCEDSQEDLPKPSFSPIFQHPLPFPTSMIKQHIRSKEIGHPCSLNQNKDSPYGKTQLPWLWKSVV